MAAPVCSIRDATSQNWCLFQNPLHIYETYHYEEVIPLLAKIEEDTSKRNYYAVGFLSFDAAPAFDSSLRARRSNDFPLLWFGIYADISVLPNSNRKPLKENLTHPQWATSLSKKEYETNLKKIRHYIQQGDIYQVNYTFSLESRSNVKSPNLVSSVDLLNGLKEYPYSAIITTKDWDIYSASPELFFIKEGKRIISKPMKGTHPRGFWFEQDESFRDALLNSEKQRAENLMIVDMVRNDLSKIAEWGSVRVDRLFEAERYPNLWQMTSQVSCLSKAGLVDIFKAMFPAASITGAPKTRAMEIINDLEKQSRGLYTGSIGFVSPNQKAQFNVAIRTLIVSNKNHTMRYGTGSGVVWDSVIQTEWEECLNKTQVLTKKESDFQLLASILWRPKFGFFLLDAHLKRILNSAQYFLIDVSVENIVRRLNESIKGLNLQSKVRLLISLKGNICVTHSPVDLLKNVHCVSFAKEPIDPRNIFLYHKTTNRRVYDEALSNAEGVDDVILWNNKKEITESTMGNIATKMNGRLITPPISSGLLPGVYRMALVEKGVLEEKKIYKQELIENKNCVIYLLNSVRKSWRVTIKDSSITPMII